MMRCDKGRGEMSSVSSWPSESLFRWATKAKVV